MDRYFEVLQGMTYNEWIRLRVTIDRNFENQKRDSVYNEDIEHMEDITLIKFTQEEFDNFPLNENGLKVCPTRDYTDIKVFGESCRFGERCSFENGQVKNGKYFACDRIGSANRKTYFFIDDNKEIFVRAGCFFGTENEFVGKLKETHGNTKFEKHYLAALELAKAVLLDD